MADTPPTPAPTPAPSTFSWTSLLLGGMGGLLLTAILAGAGFLAWWWVHTNPLPDIVLPATVTAQPGRIVEIDVQTKATDLQWDSKNDPGEWDLVMIESGHKNFFVAPLPGTYTLQLRGILSGRIAGPFACVVTVGTPTPVPPPGPVPPPVPPPAPPPIPVDGLRVLMVYDPVTIGKLPAEQRLIMYSELPGGVLTWLRDHVAKGPDGKSTEWRCLPSNENMAAESKLWQDAFARPRQSLPWVIISNGKTGFEGPLPANSKDMMSLLQRYSG